MGAFRRSPTVILPVRALTSGWLFFTGASRFFFAAGWVATPSGSALPCASRAVHPVTYGVVSTTALPLPLQPQQLTNNT